MLINKYKIIQQTEEYDCASACVAMILKNYFSVDTSLFELKPIIKNGESGTSFSDLFKGINRLGIKCKLFKAEKNIDVFDEIQFPVITQVHLDEGYHFIVIFSYSNKKITIGDPGNSAPKKVSVKKFMKDWIPFLISIDIKSSNLKIANTRLFSKISMWQYIKPVKFRILIITFISLISYLLGILLSGMFNLYFDVLIPQKFAFLVVACLIIYLIVLTFNLTLQLLKTFLSNSASKKIDKNLLINYFNGILNKPRYAINEYDSANLLTDITNISTIRNKILATIVQIPIDMLWIIVSLKILSETNNKLTIATFIMLLLLIYVSILPMQHYEKLSQNLITSMTKFNNYLMDYIVNISLIRELKIVSSFIERIGEKYEILLKKRNKVMNFDAIINTIRQFISNGFTIVLFSLGTIDIIKGTLTTGSLLMFNAILGYAIDPLLEITGFQSLLVQGKVATDRVNSALTQISSKESLSKNDPLVDEQIKKITFRNVYFAFDNNHKLLNNINFSIMCNKNTAIIGDNGSGKTTIGKLICKLLLCDSGKILINNLDIEKVPENILDKKVLFVNTDGKILNGTVLDNIILKRQVSKDKVITTTKEIGLLQDLERNNISLDTLVGSNGARLSFGQTQMIKVLQATVISKEVYVFDEITNGLDLKHKKMVVKYLMNLPGIKIYLTHDESLISSCNQVLLIDKGKVRELK